MVKNTCPSCPLIKGVGTTTFFIRGGASFGTNGCNEGMDFFVTIEKGTLGKEGGGRTLEGSTAKSVSGGGGGTVFCGEGESFLGEGGFPQGTCLTFAISLSSEDIKIIFIK